MPRLGHTNLISCFTDQWGQNIGPEVGGKKEKEKEFFSEETKKTHIFEMYLSVTCVINDYPRDRKIHF